MSAVHFSLPCHQYSVWTWEASQENHLGTNANKFLSPRNLHVWHEMWCLWQFTWWCVQNFFLNTASIFASDSQITWAIYQVWKWWCFINLMITNSYRHCVNFLLERGCYVDSWTKRRLFHLQKVVIWEEWMQLISLAHGECALSLRLRKWNY